MILKWQPILWRQLDGPQSNAIMSSIFGFFMNVCNAFLNYFESWSISSASSSDLDTIGSLQGMPRPLISIVSEDDGWFRFSSIPERNPNAGFAPPGGMLDFVTSEGDVKPIPIPSVIYKKMLEAKSKCGADVGSYILLDALCNIILPEYDLSQDTTTPGALVLSISKKYTQETIIMSAVCALWEPDTPIIIKEI